MCLFFFLILQNISSLQFSPLTPLRGMSLLPSSGTATIHSNWFVYPPRPTPHTPFHFFLESTALVILLYWTEPFSCHHVQDKAQTCFSISEGLLSSGTSLSFRSPFFHFLTQALLKLSSHYLLDRLSSSRVSLLQFAPSWIIFFCSAFKLELKSQCFC